MKDTFTVTLFDSVLSVYNSVPQDGNLDLTSADIGNVCLHFFINIVGSIGIGVVCALITTFIFNKCRFLVANNGIAQVALIIITGYFSYISS